MRKRTGIVRYSPKRRRFLPALFILQWDVNLAKIGTEIKADMAGGFVVQK